MALLLPYSFPGNLLHKIIVSVLLPTSHSFPSFLKKNSKFLTFEKGDSKLSVAEFNRFDYWLIDIGPLHDESIAILLGVFDFVHFQLGCYLYEDRGLTHWLSYPRNSPVRVGPHALNFIVRFMDLQ